MENLKQEEVQHISNSNSISKVDLLLTKHKKVKNLYMDNFLSDTIVVNKSTNKEYNSHKTVLVSGSNYFHFNFLFDSKSNPNCEINGGVVDFAPIQHQLREDKYVIELPEKIESSFSNSDDDSVISIILKFLYNNQKIKKISEEITESNIFKILSIAHSLDIEKLKKKLSKIIIEKYLNEGNCVRVFNESLLFENEELQKSCLNLMKNNFDKIFKNAEEFSMILNLPLDIFGSLIKSDDICVTSEKDICDMVMNYIKTRKNIEKVEDNKRYVEIKPESNQNPNAEIKKPESEEVKSEEVKPENPEAAENPEAPVNPENPDNKENPEKIQINPVINNSKENYVQFWNNRINDLKNKFIKKSLTKEEERSLVECIRFSFLSHNELLALSVDPSMLDHRDLILEGLSIRLNSYENTQTESNHILKVNTTPRAYASLNKEKENKNVANPTNNEIIDSARKEKSVNLNYEEDMVNLKNNMFVSQNPQQRQSQFKNQANNQFNNNMFQSQPIPPQDYNKISNAHYSPKFNYSLDEYNPNKTIEFNYDYDFDENGIFYYLGSLGKSSIFRNPHEIGQIKVLSSSLGKGKLSDLVSREMLNLRTLNEPNSYFGVDLGEERFLIPTCYSIRNRNSSSHVMMNWVLQGSNDKLNFETLDTRLFLHNDNRVSQSLEKDRSLLKTPGCTSTWGIDPKIKDKFPKGFRYFVIKQIDRNSSGGYNLAISGFELYGKGIGRWFFK